MSEPTTKAERRRRRAASEDNAQTHRPAISAAERRARIEAFECAEASMALEGFKLTAKEAAHIQRYIDGEIDMATLVEGGPDE